jgi:hypothetical protein
MICERHMMKECIDKNPLVDLIATVSDNKALCYALPKSHDEAPWWIVTVDSYLRKSGNPEDAGEAVRQLLGHARNARPLMIKIFEDEEWRTIRSVVVEAAVMYTAGGALYVASQLSEGHRVWGNLLFWPAAIGAAALYCKHIKEARTARVSYEGKLDELLRRMDDANSMDHNRWAEAMPYCGDQLRELTAQASSNPEFRASEIFYKIEPKTESKTEPRGVLS